MRHILLLLLLATTAPASAQITTDSILGAWVNTDYLGREMKLVIAQDSATFITSVPIAPGRSEMKPLIYVVNYTIENGDSLRIDETYYKVIRGIDGKLQLVTEWMDHEKKVKIIYRRE